jgi:3'-phosphoadenosine 5'-phosphosulfate sulfotransferase (PAPS reductase)/FAD synthetase
VTLRTISYGGGVQSTALLVLAATRNRDFERVMGGRTVYALFCNVGDDSEHPATIEYVRDIATPWAAERTVEVVTLQPHKKALLAHILDHDNPETLREPIPVRGMNGAPLSRSCTADWKVKRLGRWLKDQGCGLDKPPATVAVGISVDEIERAGRGRDEKWERRVYPLLDLGLRRSDCEQVIRDAGLPVPRKSSCFFCPFHSPLSWREQRRDEPELFAKAQHLEDTLNARRVHVGKDPVYLTRFGRRLSDAIAEGQDELDFGAVAEDEGCESGACWT